jgi:hypothetical protein
MQSIGVLLKNGGWRPPLHPPRKGRDNSRRSRSFSYAIALNSGAAPPPQTEFTVRLNAPPLQLQELTARSPQSTPKAGRAVFLCCPKSSVALRCGCGAMISFDCSACHAVSSPRGVKDRRDDRDSYSIPGHGQRQHFRGSRLRGVSVEALTHGRRVPRRRVPRTCVPV